MSWIRRYILFHNKRHPKDMGASEVEAFLTHLAVTENVAASTQNQALSALLFLYRHVLHQPLGGDIDAIRAKHRKHLPTVLTVVEVKAVLGAMLSCSMAQDYASMKGCAYGLKTLTLVSSKFKLL